MFCTFLTYDYITSLRCDECMSLGECPWVSMEKWYSSKFYVFDCKQYDCSAIHPVRSNMMSLPKMR